MKVTFNSRVSKACDRAMNRMNFLNTKFNDNVTTYEFSPLVDKDPIDVDLNEIGSIAREEGCSFSIEY